MRAKARYFSAGRMIGAALLLGAIACGAGGCYDCHATDGKGDSAIGAPNLTDRITLYGDGSRESLSMSISYGRHGMCPAWVGRINPAGIREAALFVYSLSQGPGSAGTAARAAGQAACSQVDLERPESAIGEGFEDWA